MFTTRFSWQLMKTASATLMLPEGASVCSNAIGTPCIDYMGFYQFGVLNQYDAQGCRPYIIDNDRRRDTLYVEYYVEEAEYTRDDEEEEWEFCAGSNCYEREADNTPMSDKGKRSL